MAWKLQFSRRKGRKYYQMVGPGRKTVALGYLDDEQVRFAEGNIAFFSERQPDFLGTLDSAAAKQALLQNPSIVDEIAAEATERELHRAIRAADYSNMTLSQYNTAIWSPIRAGEVSESTHYNEQRWAWKVINGGLGDVKIRDLSQPKWNTFLSTLTTLSAPSKRQLQNAYAVCIAHMEEIGAIPSKHTFRPIRGASDFKRPQGEALTAEEVSKLLDHAHSPMHRALYATAFGLGLRPAEASRVHWEDVNWSRNHIRIRGTKTELSAAVIPLTDATRDELHRYWLTLGCPDAGPAFLWEGKIIGGWKHGLRKAAKNAGIHLDADGKPRRIVPYSGRYTFATLAATSGVSNAAARKMLRHTGSSRMLEEVYQRLQIGQVADAIVSFPSFGSSPTPAEAQPTTTKIKPSKRTVTIATPKVAPVAPAQPTPLIAVAEGYYDDFIV